MVEILERPPVGNRGVGGGGQRTSQLVRTAHTLTAWRAVVAQELVEGDRRDIAGFRELGRLAAASESGQVPPSSLCAAMIC